MRQQSRLLLNALLHSDYDWMLEFSAYLAVAVGYLVAILTASSLTLLGLGLLTACNLVWIRLFRLLPYTGQRSPIDVSFVKAGLLAASMIIVTLLCMQLVRLGMGLDWLLPLATIAVFGVQLRPRVAVSFGIAVGLVVALSLLNLDQGWTQQFSQSSLTLLPAAIFTFGFSFVVRQQYTERLRAEALVEQLEEAQQQLRRYASEVEELITTRERNSMAREIHDTLGHYLTILAVKLETATKLDERGDPRLRSELVEARRVVSECLVEVRRSVAALRPSPVSTIQLRDGLARLVVEFEAIAPQTLVTLDVEGPTEMLSAELRLALYRSSQESLTNIRKHADATKVLLRLRVEGSHAELLVRDNGIGNSLVAHEPGFGLLGMRERIALLGGVVEAGPDPEHGWRVEVSLPIPRAVAEEPTESGGAASYQPDGQETIAHDGVEVSIRRHTHHELSR
jgi:signal transduction histidine kinase